MGKVEGTGRYWSWPGAGQPLKLGAGLEGVVLRVGCSSGAVSGSNEARTDT